MKTTVIAGLRGFVTKNGCFIPNGPNIVFVDTKNCLLYDSLGNTHQLTGDEMKSYLMSQSILQPVPQNVVDYIEDMITAGAPTQDDVPTGTSYEQEAIYVHEDAIRKCNLVITRLHSMCKESLNDRGNRARLGSAKHVRELLNEILEFIGK